MKSNINELEYMGERIIARRKQLGWSQEELAEKSDTTVQMLSTAERGAKGMRPINLIKISDALDVSADYLLKGTMTEKDDDILITKIRSLEPAQRAALEDIINTFIDVCNK